MVRPNLKKPVLKGKSAFNVIVVNQEQTDTTKCMYLVRLYGPNRTEDIDVKFTSDGSSFGDWVAEAHGQTSFGFTFKTDFNGNFLTLFYNQRCLIFRFLQSQCPPIVSDFLLSQEIQFYGINMVEDHLTTALLESYGLILQNNVHYVTHDEVSTRLRLLRGEEESQKYEFLSVLKRRHASSTSKWGNPRLPDDLISYMAFEAGFIYSLFV